MEFWRNLYHAWWLNYKPVWCVDNLLINFRITRHSSRPILIGITSIWNVRERSENVVHVTHFVRVVQILIDSGIFRSNQTLLHSTASTRLQDFCVGRKWNEILVKITPKWVVSTWNRFDGNWLGTHVTSTSWHLIDGIFPRIYLFLS